MNDREAFASIATSLRRVRHRLDVMERIGTAMLGLCIALMLGGALS